MFDLLQFPFIQRALIIGVIVSLIAAILGVFVVLRKMSFFGDAIAHSSLTGIALGLLLKVDPIIGAIVFSLLVAGGIAYLNDKKILAIDTVIGVFFASAVSLGVILIGFLKGYQASLFGFLFGDILGVSSVDIFVSVLLALFVIIFIFYSFKSLSRITFHPELAQVEGVKVRVYEYAFMLVLALTIAVTLKIVGVILAWTMIVVPAAAAKNVSSNLRQMIVFSAIFGVASALIGVIASYYLDTASGPTIVLTSSVIFVFSLLFHPQLAGK